jgi:hypothetical protein
MKRCDLGSVPDDIKDNVMRAVDDMLRLHGNKKAHTIASKPLSDCVWSVTISGRTNHKQRTICQAYVSGMVAAWAWERVKESKQ